MTNRNDRKSRKIESESAKRGMSQEEYAAELEMNRIKSGQKKQV